MENKKLKKYFVSYLCGTSDADGLGAGNTVVDCVAIDTSNASEWIAGLIKYIELSGVSKVTIISYQLIPEPSGDNE